jgi:hypothetical protein
MNEMHRSEAAQYATWWLECEIPARLGVGKLTVETWKEAAAQAAFPAEIEHWKQFAAFCAQVLRVIAHATPQEAEGMHVMLVPTHWTASDPDAVDPSSSVRNWIKSQPSRRWYQGDGYQSPSQHRAAPVAAVARTARVIDDLI